jgi:transcriptional regulator with XRE-family HTH domain
MRELANEAGISLTLLAMIEYGKRVPNLLVTTLICDILSIDQDWLLYGTHIKGRKSVVSLTPVYRKTPLDSATRLQKSKDIRAAIRNSSKAYKTTVLVHDRKKQSESGGVEAPIRPGSGLGVSDKEGSKLEG